MEKYWMKTHPESNYMDVKMLKPSDLCDYTWKFIFDFQFPMIPRMDKKELCKMILMHYFTREIGMETISFWKQRLEVRMKEIMPYYVELANAQIDLSQALINNDVSEKTYRTGGEQNVFNKEENLSQTQNANTNTSQSTVVNRENNEENLVSDTPQDGLEAVRNGTYLSGATINKNTDTDSQNFSSENSMVSNGSQESKGNESRDRDYSEDITRKLTGFNGDKLSVVEKYRELILQIPRMIIKDLSDLFLAIL